MRGGDAGQAAPWGSSEISSRPISLDPARVHWNLGAISAGEIRWPCVVLGFCCHLIVRPGDEPSWRDSGLLSLPRLYQPALL